MLRFAVPILLSLAAIAKAFHYDPLPFYTASTASAASEAQIRFALENKYDDTGPGAKQPEYAYNTYKTLEEALVGYLDDPDTKLPEYERNRAMQLFVKPKNNEEYQPEYDNKVLKRYYPKTVEEYTGYNRQKTQQQSLDEYTKSSQPKTVPVYKYRQPQSQLVLTKLRTSPHKKYYQSLPQQDNRYLKQFQRHRVAQPFILEEEQPFKTTPVKVAHYALDSDLQNAHDQFDPYPKYTFSYGVHAPDTGDSKSAHETREGGTVRGYYSYTDPDGKRRTVHYTADDKQGFRATVDRAEHHYS